MFLETDVAMDNAQGFAGVVGFGMGVSQSARHAAGDRDGQLNRNHAALFQPPVGRIARD